MKVNEVMTRDVKICSPDQTIREAARLMAECDCGVIPISDNDRLIGMLTDRDVAIRAIAEGKGPDVRIKDVMTADIRYCFEDEDTHRVAENMADQQIRRIPVVNRDKRLVGILSLGDLAFQEGPEPAGEALSGIVRPSSQHNQRADRHA